MDQYEIVRAGTHEPAPHILHEGVRPNGEIDTLAALKRRRVLIALLVVVAMLATYLVSRLITPLYEAEAGIMFNPRELTWMGATTQPGTLPPSEETARKNEVAIVRSRGLAEAVVDRLGLDRLPEFNRTLREPSLTQSLASQGRALVETVTRPVLALLPGGDAADSDAKQAQPPLRPDHVRDEVINAFQRRLETSSADASRVIGIRFWSEDSERAALIANTVADHFIAQKRDLEVAAAANLARNLTQEIADLNRDIRDAERMIEEMRLDLGLHSDSNVRALDERLTELNRQMIGATAERLRAEAQFAEAQSVGQSGIISSAEVLNSPLIQRLQEQAALASAQVGQLEMRYNSGHPSLIAARSELRIIRNRINDEVNKIQNARQNAVAIAKANEEGLRRQIEALKVQMDKANASEVDVRVMEREVEAKRTLLPQLASRLNNANAQLDYLKLHGPDTQVISRAVVPRFPSSPPTLAMLATAFVLALGGAGILAVLLERADHTIQSLTQIRRMTPIRIIGALPMVRGSRWQRRPPAEHVAEQSDPLYVEHLRAIALRAGLGGSNPSKVLLFTSSVSDEGKSSAASSLARMLALSGHRVVIIDGDLRAPTMHRVFKLGRGPGLSEFVVEGRGLDEIIQADTASGADVITAGHALGSPADILQSARLQELVGDLAIAYDVVIIDSPPVLAACDAHILARLADRTLMMVRWRSTQATTLMTALQRLSDDRVPVDGIVLSRVDGRKYRLFGYADSDMFSAGFRKYYTR